MRTLPIRPLRRAAGLIVFAFLVTGCFQTAGAALDATATPNGGAGISAVTLVPTTVAAPPTAITPVAALSTDQTSLTPATPTTDPNLISPTVALLVFTTATPTASPTDTTLTVAALSFVTSTDVPTATPTGTPSPTIGSAFLTFTPVVSDTPVLSATPGPSATPVVLIVTATPLPVTNTPVVIVITATPSPITPTLTPSITLTPTPTATEPRIITPTKVVAVAQAATNPPAFNADQATQTQQANAALATAIIQTSTASAGQQLTLVATLQGTGIPAGGQAATPEPPTPAPNGVQVTFTPTPLPVINTATVTGATGPITADCIYTVQPGDHLFRIAMRFNLTPYQIAYANNLINPDLLRLNQTLRIPACNVPPVAFAPAPSTTPTTSPIVTPIPVGGSASAASAGGSGKTYMVVDGDTLYSIANRFGVRVIALAQANGITNISLIYIGQMLVIPG